MQHARVHASDGSKRKRRRSLLGVAPRHRAPSPLLQVPAERGNAPRPGAAARHLSTPLMQLPQPPPLAHALQRAARICHAGISLLRLLPRVLYLLPLPLQVGQDCRARGLPGRKRWGIAWRVSRLARSTGPGRCA